MGATQICRECQQTLPWGAFYKHPRMVSGRDTICKECVKERVRENRSAKADYYRAYDRKRYREQPQRKAAAQRSANSPAGIESRKRSLERRRTETPEKYRANNAVNNALRDGKIEREPCFFCGATEKLHAHHEDYSHPLDVVWLCASCHGKLHTIKGDFRRAG